MASVRCEHVHAPGQPGHAIHQTSHQHDVTAILAQAEAHCASRNVKLTPLRRQVLALILASDRPLGAYDLLGRMAGSGRPPAPPTVYRSLDFLLEQGLIHRLASINAFVACCHPRQGHAAQTLFLICMQCQQVSEVDSSPVQEVSSEIARQSGFALEQAVIELSGKCAACQVVSTE